MSKTFEKLRKVETNSSQYLNFDIASLLRDISGAELWKDKKALWTAISGACSQYSKQTYSKLNSFVKNVTDIDYCNIHTLKSIAKSVNAQHLTQFINQDYPVQLLNLINLFSISQNLILKDSGILNEQALTNVLGTIDQRNRDIYIEKNGYSELLFHQILNKLDQIKYLLQTVNEINFNFSIWNYINFKNKNIKFCSLSSILEGDNEVITYSSPSINKIFEELYYLRDSFSNVYENSLLDEKLINKYKIGYQENYGDQYLGLSNFWQLNKQFIIKKCSKLEKIKESIIYKKYFQKLAKEENNNLYLDYINSNDIGFGWNPYDLQVLNNYTKFKFINNLNIDENTIIINPFIILIAIIKNNLFNAQTGKRLILNYVDEKTQLTTDLSLLILNCCQSIQNSPDVYYNEMIVYHFYGLFYDMIINDYLKNEWEIYLDNNIINTKFIGIYSEYTKQEFIKKLPISLKSQSLIQFFENGPEYFNQYHVDFITYLNIINNLLQNNQKQFSYIITNYNNDFALDDIKNNIYNAEKRRLLGFKTSINYIESLNSINIQTNSLKLDIENSIVYKIACKFADYCIKIKNTRESIKSLVQQYARIGTKALIQDVIKQYFYKNFSDKKQWLLYNDGKNLNYLSAYNLLNPLSSYTSVKNRFSIDLIEYYDTTKYLNIYAEKPKEIYDYISGQTKINNVECSGSTPSTYIVKYRLDKDVISSATQKSYLDNSQLILANSILDFDNIAIDNDTSTNPILQYIPTIAAVSSITSTYIKNVFSTFAYVCNYYYTNGYNDIALSSNWTLSDLPAVTSSYSNINNILISHYGTNLNILNSQDNTVLSQTKYEFLNSNLFLSSLYDVNSDQFKKLLEANNIQYNTNIELSTIIAPLNTYIIPAGTLVEKAVTGTIDYTYNILSTFTQKIPLYKDAEITGTYNYRFWQFENINSNELTNILSSQVTYWEKYFPELKNTTTNQLKIKIFKNKIYPFLSSIFDIYAVSGYNNQLSGLTKQYSGNILSGDYATYNISNDIFPTIAPTQFISNLIPTNQLDTENNLYINLYLNTFYKDLEKYSQNVLQSLIECNQKYENTSIGYPVSSWYSSYTTFNGYNSVYGQDNNLDESSVISNKYINVDGPWIYTILQYFIKLYYTSDLNKDNFQFNSLRGPLAFSRLINTDTYIPIAFNFTRSTSNSKIINTIIYDDIYDFVKRYYNIKVTSEIENIANKIFLYQQKIINKQYYNVYDYKEDMYGNSFTLFKYYQYNKYEDAGQIWIRQKNQGLSIPVMFCRQIKDNQDYNYDWQDVLILKQHNIYASMLKQLFNNAIQFNIYDNTIWILGYTNYIKGNKSLKKQDNLFLKLCVFSYTYNSVLNKYVIDINSIKFISEKYNNDYLNNINCFVGAYNNFNNKTIQFVLNDNIQLNSKLSNEYKKYELLLQNQNIQQNFQQFINNKLDLNNLTIPFIKVTYDIDSKQLLDNNTINMNNAKYPLIGLFNQQQLCNNIRFGKQYTNGNDIIQNYIGDTIEIYKFTNNISLLPPIQKIGQTNITLNNEYKSVDIIFNKLDQQINYQIHKECKSYNRNIIGCFYNSQTKQYQNLDFSNVINNPFSGYFALSGNFNYLFKILPYNQCQCNLDRFQEQHLDYLKSVLSANYNFNKITFKGYLLDKISNYKQKFESSLQIHVYYYLKQLEKQHLFNYHYLIYYLDNDNIVNSLDLGTIKQFHKMNCYYSTLTKENQQHIWKTNLNINQFFIAYEAINPDIQQPTTYYKDLFYSEKEDLYIDTIIFEGTIYKKKIDTNTYANLVSDITIKYGSDKVDLPFTFSQLSSNIIPQGSYYYKENIKSVKNVVLTGEINTNWCLRYGNEFNKIHENYPKCQIKDNKLKCTTILTKLGGKKDFVQDISNNIKGIEFLSYYILNSSFRKKLDTKYLEGSDAYYIFKSLETTSGKYSISDYLFMLKQLEYFKGSQYFDYNFEEGFTDIYQILSKIKNKSYFDNIYIGNKTYNQYIKQLEEETGDTEKEILSKNKYEIFEKGFKYNFYPYNQKNYELYLTYMNALPAFTTCFNDNLKIYISFGQLSQQIRNFITGSQSFDLDISVYINDSNYGGSEYLKKVGWHCGYISTQYLNWKSNDNRNGGPEYVQVNLQKYLNYLYNKYVTTQEYDKPNYQKTIFNSIAQNIDIHIDVCWHNESMLISLNPYLQIYWKGIYHKVEIDGHQLSKNRKCCKDSWSYDIFVDLANNVLSYNSASNLYPVFATDLAVNNYYVISSTNNIYNNKEINKKGYNINNYIYNTNNIISFENLYNNYSNYQLTQLNIYDFCISSYITNLAKTNTRQYILSSLISSSLQILSSKYTTYDIKNFVIEGLLNANAIQPVYYSQRETTIKSSYNNLNTYPLTIIKQNYSSTSVENLYNIFEQDIVRNRQLFAVIYQIAQILTRQNFDINFIIEVYNNFFMYFKQYIEVDTLFKQFINDNIRNISFSISSYQQYIPSTFNQYYISTDDVSSLLYKLSSNQYYPKLTVQLSSQIGGGFLLDTIVTDKTTSNDNIIIIDKNDQGYIIVIQKNDNLQQNAYIRRSAIVTNLSKIMKTHGNTSLKLTNYKNIDAYVNEYLQEALTIEIPSSIYNVYNGLIPYTPQYSLLLQPLLRYYVINRKCSLDTKTLISSYNDILIRYKDFGFYFDQPLQYNVITKNILTNNFNIKYNFNIDNFIFNKNSDINILNNNEYSIDSEILTYDDSILDTIYPKFNEIYNQIGYQYQLRKINEFTEEKELISKTEYLCSQYIEKVPETTIQYQYSNELNGILELTIKPFYTNKYVRRYIQQTSIIISNYKTLFTQTIPSSSIENKNSYELTNNEIYLVNSKFDNEIIFQTLNNYLTLSSTPNIYFRAYNIKYPLSLIYNFNGQQKTIIQTNDTLQLNNNTTLELENNIVLQLENYITQKQITLYNNTYIIEGIGKEVNDFDYTISAYQNIGTYTYLVGLIHGYYRYKTIEIENIRKNNKNEFTFTTNMTNNQINSELLSENIVSSIITIPSTTINISNTNYSDLDFINQNLEDNIQLIIG